jgi:outer membrane protein assembly factor BamD (BamD/ComL family)
MSSSGVSGSTFSDLQQVQQELQQLGHDLNSGNLSAAQADFVTFQQDITEVSSSAPAGQVSSVTRAFIELAQNLQSGNLTAAQQDYASIRQDFQSQSSQMYSQYLASGSQQSEFNQVFSQLGQNLQSGNLAGARSDFNTLQHLLQSNSSNTQPGTTYTGVSINA